MFAIALQSMCQLLFEPLGSGHEPDELQLSPLCATPPGLVGDVRAMAAGRDIASPFCSCPSCSLCVVSYSFPFTFFPLKKRALLPSRCPFLFLSRDSVLNTAHSARTCVLIYERKRCHLARFRLPTYDCEDRFPLRIMTKVQFK